MYKVAVERSDANKIALVEGDTLETIAATQCDPGTTWEHLALYNWGTTDAFEVNRALVELLGCSKVNEAEPQKSVLDPALGTTKALHAPKTWAMPPPLAVEKTHTLKLRRRRPPPAAVLTQVDPWFIPETENCDIGWRIEGIKERADKIDFDVYASNYCSAAPTVDERFVSFAYTPLDIPILQKRAFAPHVERKADTYVDWKGESEAGSGVLKPRDGKKRHVNVACSPYGVVLRYYKADADKDAKITLKPFWPRFKKVLKDAADTTGIDPANASGMKGDTQAAFDAARELELALVALETEIGVFVPASERAALRAHGAFAAAAKAVADIDLARTAMAQAQTDVDAAKAAAEASVQANQAAALAPLDVVAQGEKVTKANEAATTKGTAKVSTTEAKTKAATAHTSMRAAEDALALAKAMATSAATRAGSSATKADAAETAAGKAKTKAGAAKAAVAGAPEATKTCAAEAETQGNETKPPVDDVKAKMAAANTSAGTFRGDADTAAASGASASAETLLMTTAAGKAAAELAKATTAWNVAKTQADESVTKGGTARPLAEQARTQGQTSQTSADAARIASAKVAVALAKAKPAVDKLRACTDATDDRIVYDASLKATWKIEKSAKLKHGQLLLLDKDNKPLFRKPLQASDLTQDSEISCDIAADDQAKYWLDAKTKLDLSLDAMPYRVQLQAHSDWEEDDGVALAVMHTEVRLWVHQDSGSHATTLDDAASLQLGLAPWRPEADALGKGTTEWYKLKLAEAGFHPGPVNPSAAAGDTDPYKVALAEFQRSFTQEEAKPFTRLINDGAPNGPTAEVLARTDVADKAAKETTDIKADTKATLDAAEAAKLQTETAATDAAATKAAARQAVTSADEAVVAAKQAAADAGAAKTAADTALADVTTARDALIWKDSRAATAKGSVAQAAATAATAMLSASAAAAKADQAKLAAEDIATKAGTAKVSAGLATTAVGETLGKADATKVSANSAANSVKQPVGVCATQAKTADTTAGRADESVQAADASATAAKTSATAAALSANSCSTDAIAFDMAAKLVVVPAQAGNFVQSFEVASTAASLAAAAQTSAERAQTDAANLKAKAEAALRDAHQAVTRVDLAKTDAAIVAQTAKRADDAAEAERLAKAQRKAKVDKLLRPSLAMFGDPSTRGDHTRDAAEPLLGDKSKTLITWVDDRHYYTEGVPAAYSSIAMNNYRTGMKTGDGERAIDQRSIARPWIPFEVRLPLLGKGQPLMASGPMPPLTEAMQRAIGPLRIDWSFDELPPEVDNIPRAEPTLATPIAARDRTAAVKARTAEAVTAAGDAKLAAPPMVTRATAAQTELGKLVTAVGEAQTLAQQAVTDLVAAQAAAELAKTQVNAAALPQAAPSAAQQAKASCVDAVAKANVAVQRATEAMAKLTSAKDIATAMAAEADHAKSEAGTLAGNVDALRNSLTEADVTASVAGSAGAVTGAIGQASTAIETATKSTATAKTKIESADTAARKCVTDARDAETAADLTKTRAATLKASAELAKTQVDSGSWPLALVTTASAAIQAGEAKQAADQATLAVVQLKTDTDAGKLEIDQAKIDADTAKVDVDAVEPLAQTVDAEAETDRQSRVAAGDSAAGTLDTSLVAARGLRPRTWVEQTLGTTMARALDGRTYTNTPALLAGTDYGGIRPETLTDYYKSPFGLGKAGSNRPWLAIDDTANKVVSSVVHDDLGQDSALVFGTHLGKAGVFLNTSRIAGDGYRVRAQANFRALPAAASHPNHEALQQRYVRLPAVHSAGLRLWRKAAFRGYGRWSPTAVAGWQGYFEQVRDKYRAAHVHFVYDGDDPNTPTEFPMADAVAPDEYVTPAEFKAIVESRVTGDFAGLDAQYTSGYVWPYLHLAEWGIPPADGDFDAMTEYLSSTLKKSSWQKYRYELIYLILKNIEERAGRLRGHLLVEFETSPTVIIARYTCDQPGCGSKFCAVANDPAGTKTKNGQKYDTPYRGEECRDASCPGYYNTVHTIENGHLSLPAVGGASGGAWLFMPRSAETWAHEIGHHRHMQHAQANSKNEIAPGGQVDQHDSQTNAMQANAPYQWQRFWDRWCLMSYDKSQTRTLCGACLLKNSGWLINQINDPAAELQDG